ncbi:isochorismatase family protein [Buttiauxella warmboldiae]|uniref:Isochorismatase family protein n=1 Tax=Buttiauxella warmboldiae TaxID=82993 RepID=A0A3N5D612_9ENTR|nr:isochorismatase family protein [Buttiauxella warmboldiae]
MKSCAPRSSICGCIGALKPGRRANLSFIPFKAQSAGDLCYRTKPGEILRGHQINEFVVCGCTTVYCVGATIKNGASRGYAIAVALDAHTTANRQAAFAEVLIEHDNDVWRDFIIPGNPLRVKTTAEILSEW